MLAEEKRETLELLAMLKRQVGEWVVGEWPRALMLGMLEEAERQGQAGEWDHLRGTLLAIKAGHAAAGPAMLNQGLVTPAMIEAGAEALHGTAWNEEAPQAVSHRVLRAALLDTAPA